MRRTRRRLRPPAWDVWALGRCVGHHRPPMWGRGMDAVTAGADALWCDSSGGRSRAVASGTALGAASSAQLLCFSPSFSILLPTPSIPPPRLPTSDNTRGHAARHHGLYPRDDVPPSPSTVQPVKPEELSLPAVVCPRRSVHRAAGVGDGAPPAPWGCTFGVPVKHPWRGSCIPHSCAWEHFPLSYPGSFPARWWQGEVLHRAVRVLAQLPREAGDAPSLEVFKARLGGAPGSPV